MMKALLILFFLLAGPMALMAQSSASPLSPQSKSLAQKEIPTIDFCEIVKNPNRFFGRTIRTEAVWQSGFEFSYLTGEHCAPKFRHEIAVRFVPPLSDETRTHVKQIQSHEYGGRAIIRAVGTLRNPGKYFGYYRYQFDLLRFEEVSHVIVPFKGTLEAGKTYRARVYGDRDLKLSPDPALRVEAHYAVRIVWLNISTFPTLEKLYRTPADLVQIVFSVTSDERKQITERRWNRTLECKIIRVE